MTLLQSWPTRLLQCPGQDGRSSRHEIETSWEKMETTTTGWQRPARLSHRSYRRLMPRSKTTMQMARWICSSSGFPVWVPATSPKSAAPWLSTPRGGPCHRIGGRRRVPRLRREWRRRRGCVVGPAVMTRRICGRRKVWFARFKQSKAFRILYH